MPYTPSVRKPTGIPAAPLIMVSGPAKSGRSVASYSIVNSPRVAACRVIDLGEGTADEYAEIGPYEVVDWGKSWRDLSDSVAYFAAEPVEPGKVNALIIDDGTNLWDGLKDRASARARNSDSNRKALAADPDATVTIATNLWNDAAAAWTSVVNPMKKSATLVGVIIVRADEVMEMQGERPTNRRIISLQAHKSLESQITAHVEIHPDHSAWLVSVRALRANLPAGGLRLDPTNPLGHVLDVIVPVETSFGSSSAAMPVDTEREIPPEMADAIALFDAIKALDPDTRTAFGNWARAAEFVCKTDEMAADAGLRAAVRAHLREVSVSPAEAAAIANGLAAPRTGEPQPEVDTPHEDPPGTMTVDMSGVATDLLGKSEPVVESSTGDVFARARARRRAEAEGAPTDG